MRQDLSTRCESAEQLHPRSVNDPHVDIWAYEILVMLCSLAHQQAILHSYAGSNRGVSA